MVKSLVRLRFHWASQCAGLQQSKLILLAAGMNQVGGKLHGITNATDKPSAILLLNGDERFNYSRLLLKATTIQTTNNN